MRTSDGEAAYLKVTPATLGAQPLAAARDTGTVTVAYGTPASTDVAGCRARRSPPCMPGNAWRGASLSP
ncbi:hypothetical protein [Streptomyces sp. NPDC056227]|uniref:hypothetical protein n=1 Tax=Streptomyces sp. NPDC056227 TaxID=3345753 RepID=UPI0035D6A7BE